MYIGMVCGVHFFNFFFLKPKGSEVSTAFLGVSVALVLEGGGGNQHFLHLFVHMTCSCLAGKRVAEWNRNGLV